MSAAASPLATSRGRIEEDDAPDHLLCPICLEASNSFVYQCRNGHLLCSDCLEKLRSRARFARLLPTCPTCRIVLPEDPIRNLVAEHWITLLPATCRHCNGKTTRGVLVSHESSCPSAPATCHYCNGTSTRGALLSHGGVCPGCAPECAIDQLSARFEVDRMATASVMDALLGTMTSTQQQCKNKALLLAAAHDRLAPLVMQLIAGGAEVYAARPSDGYTPLLLACIRGDKAMVERLIAAGSRVNNASTGSVTPITPFFLAAGIDQLGFLKLLVTGADVNRARFDLHTTVRNGHTGVVSMLHETAGVEFDKFIAWNSAPQSAGRLADITQLYVPAGSNRLDVLKLLITAGADVEGARFDGCTPLHITAQHTGVMSVLLGTAAAGVEFNDFMAWNSAPSVGRLAGITPLQVAAQDNRLDMLTLLITTGADVNMARVTGVTPLHAAVEEGHADVVTLLIAAGANVNATCTDGEFTGITPLYVAAEYDRLGILELLIATGAEVNMARNDGATPLHVAAEKGHVGIETVLIEIAGVDLNAAPVDGVAPVFIAAQDNRLGILKLLIAAGADLNTACVDGCTPLLTAAECGHADVVDILIAAGANVHAACDDGATALSLVLAQGLAEEAQKLRAAGANEYDDDDESDDSE
jgi:ankyrin repeat protein